LQAHAAPHGDTERALLAGLANVTLRNWRGTEVGRLAVKAA
jgi:hypothetical protein